MNSEPEINLWPSAEHALDYLRRADSIPHRVEGESTLLEFLPLDAQRILDLGSGGGRLIALVKALRPQCHLVGLDFSPVMLETLQRLFAEDRTISIVNHDFSEALPPIGQFDAVISSFAIHHVSHERKRILYEEIFETLVPGGVLCNLEHVASPTRQLHSEFLRAISCENEDPSNQLLNLDVQLRWMREIGFVDVDCHWKWRELALLTGRKPSRPRNESRVSSEFLRRSL